MYETAFLKKFKIILLTKIFFYFNIMQLKENSNVKTQCVLDFKKKTKGDKND